MAKLSKVIHVRNVSLEISEKNLLELFKPFGVVTKIVVLQAKNQALLQMEDIPAAVKAIEFYSNVQPNICGRNVYIQFSSHQELTKIQNYQSRVDEPNRILLVTIPNKLHPISVEMLNDLFSPYGFVEKIVIFHKSAGFQALIQYKSFHCSNAARIFLQGRKICDDCCQLHIQFSNLDELQVNYNNERTRDFTKPFLPSNPKKAKAIEKGTKESCTVVVSNLNPDRIDEDKLFNLFSIYGNIRRLKLIRNKPGQALVQMNDGFQSALAVNFLMGVLLFGKRLVVNFSKRPIITTSSDTREYSITNGNRFNRLADNCYLITKTIQVSSLPQDVTKEEIVAHFDDWRIIRIKLFEKNGKKQALVLFEKEEQAIAALVCKQATLLGSSTIRVAFSHSKTS